MDPSPAPLKPERSPLVSCLVGCGIAVGVTLLLVIVAAAFVTWRLVRQGPEHPEVHLRDGTETSWLVVDARPDDAGLVAVASTLSGKLDETRARANVPWAGLFHSNLEGDLRRWLPARVEVVYYPDGSFAARARSESGGRSLRMMFRTVGWIVSRRTGSEVTSEEIDGVPVMHGKPESPGIALIGDRFLVAGPLARLRSLLEGSHADPEADEKTWVEETDGLAEAARLPDEDVHGYYRSSDPAIRAVAWSADLATADRVTWRTAVRLHSPPADPEAFAEKVEPALLGWPIPEGTEVTIDGTKRWLDDRTLVVSGSVDGIEGLLDGFFEEVNARRPANR